MYIYAKKENNFFGEKKKQNAIHHFHISHNAPNLPPCNTQDKWNTKVMQNLNRQIRCIIGNVEVVYDRKESKN